MRAIPYQARLPRLAGIGGDPELRRYLVSCRVEPGEIDLICRVAQVPPGKPELIAIPGKISEK